MAFTSMLREFTSGHIRRTTSTEMERGTQLFRMSLII